MTINWKIEGDLATICPFSKEVIIRIEIPLETVIEITHQGKKNVYVADDFTLKQSGFLGGQCEGRYYKITGFLSSDFDAACPFTTDIVDLPSFRGPINSIETNYVDSVSSTFISINHDNPEKIHTEELAFLLLNRHFRPREGLSQFDCGELIGGGLLYAHPAFDWKITGVKPANDSISIQDDINECGNNIQFTVELYKNGDLIETLIYEDTSPVVKKIEGEFKDPIYEKVDLYYVQFVQIRRFQKATPNGQQLCRQIYLVFPILNFSIPNDSGGNPFEDNVFLLISEYCSPPGLNKYPRISHTCECDEKCPEHTICSIQNGEKSCCYDAKGNVIKVVDAGCFEADIKC